MTNAPRDVVVIGGGISGLTLAWHLHRAGVDVCLLEADAEVGGCTRTEQRNGFFLEKGPFNVLVRDPAFEDLLDGVADDVKVVTAGSAARKRFIYRHGALRQVPTNPVALAITPLLTVGGRLGLVTGLLLSGRAGDREETIEQVAVRRFGRDVADTLMSAVVSGIFAGDIRRLSLRACFPAVADVDRQARSLLAYGLSRAFSSKGKRRRKYKGLISAEGGLGALTGSLGKALGPNLRTNFKVQSIRRIDGGYEISPHNQDGTHAPVTCRRLVIASSADAASGLLAPIIPEASDILASIESSSLVVLNLGFRASDVSHPLKGYGFLVPHNEKQFPLMGVLWADSIFPHFAPENKRLLRVFMGGAHDPTAVNRSDEELLATSMDAMRDLLGVSGDPILVDICRYKAAVPQYHLGHTEVIARLRSLVAGSPGLYLAGNYLGGVGVNDCIKYATSVARQLLDERTHTGASHDRARSTSVDPVSV
ncbi:MAG: protoporphyrinogen oxidase [Phycisphaerae bacterium]|jgi:oxygen-dependent protoporphyrinogen oxidase